MSLICAFTVPCAAIPCSNVPIQGACINKLRHRRLQKFHHPIKEKERQKAVLSGTMVVGLAVNCGMLPWLFKEHLPVHLSQSEMMPTILLMKAMSKIPVA